MRYFLPTFVFANSFNHQIGPSFVLNLMGCELSFILASTYCCFVGKSAKNLNFKEDGSTGQVWNYIRYPRQLLSSFNVLIKFFLRILFLFIFLVKRILHGYRRGKEFYHRYYGIIQGFPALRKAVITHVEKYRIFTCVFSDSSNFPRGGRTPKYGKKNRKLRIQWLW